jgi:hypothetical protein
MPLRAAALALSAAVAAGVSPAAAAERAASAAPPGLHVLMINGGGDASENFHSHLLHLQQLGGQLLGAGVPAERITVLASDGADPAPDVATRASDPEGFWMLDGTWLGRALAEPTTYQSSTLPGLRLQPATRQTLTRWFESARTRLRPGDTLLLYVTDHGTDDPRDPEENRIVLWGRRESISVRRLRALIERLPRGVRVVALMSQCFSGGFAHLAHAHARAGLPDGDVCGYFSSTADRPAYGCYPEVAGRDRTGHSFEMFEGLAAGGRLAEAHAQVLGRDDTPDVPLRTSDVFLEERLRLGARAAGEDPAAFAERALAEARRAPGAWDEELRLAERVARAFGLEPARTLAAVEAARKELEELRLALDGDRELWDGALTDGTRAQLERFLAARPRWRARLRPAALRRLGAPGRRALTAELLRELATFASPEQRQRLEQVLQKSDAAGDIVYRMEVREAVLLRVRTLLLTAAGRARLAARGSPDERAALQALRACEALVLPTGRRPAPPAPPPRFEPLTSDRQRLPSLRPSWLGIAFEPLPDRLRARLRLAPGAARVTQVLPQGPAARAGLRAGDIVLGEPGRAFGEPSFIRLWAMLSPAGEARPLELLRRGARQVVRVTPAPHEGRETR